MSGLKMQSFTSNGFPAKTFADRFLEDFLLTPLSRELT